MRGCLLVVGHAVLPLSLGHAAGLASDDDTKRRRPRQHEDRGLQGAAEELAGEAEDEQGDEDSPK